MNALMVLTLLSIIRSWLKPVPAPLESAGTRKGETALILMMLVFYLALYLISNRVLLPNESVTFY